MDSKLLSTTEFLKYLRFERNYSQHTISSYRKDISQFREYLISHLDLVSDANIGHAHIRSWLVHLMTRGYEPRSINRKLSSLKSYFRFLKKKGLLKLNPASKVSGPKVAKRLPQFIRSKDIAHGLDLTKMEDSFDARRKALIVSLFYQTGIRRNELIQLKDRDIDLVQNQIKVLGKGNKERIIPIGPKLSKEIQSYIVERDNEIDKSSEYLLITNKGMKMYPKFVYNIINEWLSSISTVSKRSPHMLRHSFATHLADNGAELNAIKELLGHASLAATEIYMHNSVERLKGVYKKSHPRATKR